MIEPRYLTPKQCAVYTGLGLPTLYRWAEEGKMPSLKVSNRLLFDRLAVDAWLSRFARQTPWVSSEVLREAAHSIRMASDANQRAGLEPKGGGR